MINNMMIEFLQNLSDAISDKYDDLRNNVKKYDLTTDEGYEKFIKDAAELRKELIDYDTYFSRKLVELLDSLVTTASQKHEEVKETEKKKAAEKKAAADAEKARVIEAEVERTNSEKPRQTFNTISDISNRIGDSDEIDWPSAHISSKQRRQIWELVDEYMDEKVLPYVQGIDGDKIDNMASGLFEFAAWILKHEK